MKDKIKSGKINKELIPFPVKPEVEITVLGNKDIFHKLHFFKLKRKQVSHLYNNFPLY